MRYLLFLLTFSIYAHAAFLPPPTVQLVSPGSSTGKTQVNQTSPTITTTGTAYTPIMTYVTTTGKTYYITYFEMEAGLSTVSATGAKLGHCSLEIPTGSSVFTYNFGNPTSEQIDRVSAYFSEPIPVASGQTTRISCVPAGSTATYWQGNIGGYQK